MIHNVVIAAFVYDHSDLIAEEYRQETKRRNSERKGWLRRWEKNRPKEARKALEAELKRRKYIESAPQPIYQKPWRPHFWNIRDYREWNVRLRLKTGGFIKADRQKGGAVRYPVAAAVPWERLIPTKIQRPLIDIGRFYKWDCSWPPITGYLDDFSPFDQRPSAYLHPEHAPPREPRDDKVIECPARWNYQRLKDDQPAHNAKSASCWNIPTRVYRQQGTLNIPRETVVTGIINRQHQAPSLPQLAEAKLA